MLEPRQFAGMALIGIGLAFIDGRLPHAIGLGDATAVSDPVRSTSGRRRGPIR
jgi:hypothetical protein